MRILSSDSRWLWSNWTTIDTTENKSKLVKKPSDYKIPIHERVVIGPREGGQKYEC